MVCIVICFHIANTVCILASVSHVYSKKWACSVSFMVSCCFFLQFSNFYCFCLVLALSVIAVTALFIFVEKEESNSKNKIFKLYTLLLSE